MKRYILTRSSTPLVSEYGKLSLEICVLNLTLILLCSAVTAAAAAWPMLAKAAKADDGQGVASSRMSYSRFLVCHYLPMPPTHNALILACSTDPNLLHVQPVLTLRKRLMME